jgi:hypothetical protein
MARSQCCQGGAGGGPGPWLILCGPTTKGTYTMPCGAKYAYPPCQGVALGNCQWQSMGENCGFTPYWYTTCPNAGAQTCYSYVTDNCNM